MLLKMLKHLLKGRHYVEFICSKRVVAAAKSFIRNGSGYAVIPDFLFILIIQLNRQRITKCPAVGFAYATWAIVLYVRVVALIAKNAF